MHYLTIDEQTISDLSIFGKAGKASIFDLYNKTVTQGGSARLTELFRSPLSDVNAINERVALYRSFCEKEFSFPVDSETIGAMGYYLENEDVRTQLQVGNQSFGQRFKDMVAADADQVFVQDGVQACLRLFYKLGVFIKDQEDSIRGTAYEASFNLLKDSVNDEAFAIVRQNASAKYETKLSTALMADMDKGLRFEKREKLLIILNLLFELDVYIAIGQVARKRGFHFAKALPRELGVLTYQEVYHPHVENAIPNDLSLNSDHNILFLTGANMAGKSTLMKSIGVALYLGHMGFPVAAKDFSFSVRDGIYTSINLSDNLSQGASHYYAEVLRVKEVARELSVGKQLFVIFDELFRGTNVKDAFDATIAITRAFGRKRGSQFIISTHIMEAGEQLQKEPLSIKYQYLPTEMKGNVPVYPRILREGITADRQGMIIIQNEGILDMLDAGLTDKED